METTVISSFLFKPHLRKWQAMNSITKLLSKESPNIIDFYFEHTQQFLLQAQISTGIIV